MECLQVLEAGEGIEQSILRQLRAWGGLRGQCASVDHPALLVVSPQAAARGIPLPRQCRTVLLPGGMRGTPPQAASAVSYGPSPRDSLTISSREGDTLWAALQRELVTVDGRVVDTPPKELELLFHLASNPNRVYTRDQLLDEVWGFEYYGDSRTVDVHVKRLREKLEGVSDQWSLKTVWGVGYKFEVKE